MKQFENLKMEVTFSKFQINYFFDELRILEIILISSFASERMRSSKG